MPTNAAKSEAVNRPKRRWFSYSLRTMFLLVTAIGVICAVVVWKMVPAIQQKNAVSALRGNGAVVRYDFEESYSYVDTKGRPQPEPTPGWAASVLGVDAVHDVTRVQLNETGFRDHDEFEKAVYTLRYLPRLGWLDILASREIKDDALRSITGLRQLYCLNLSVGHLSDVALRYVSVLDGLIDLDVSSDGVTNDDLVTLAKLTNLQALSLYDNAIDDAGLRHLANFRTVSYLILAKNHIKGEGLRDLTALPKLENLTLDECPITDDGLKSLPALPGMIHLSLVRTAITDASIPVLAKLPGCCEINIAGTKISPEGAAELHKLHPHSYIFTQGPACNESSNASPVYISPDPPGPD